MHDWFIYFFVNTLLPYFCEREIDGERGMNVVTHIKSMNILIEYNDLKAEGAFETVPWNSKDASLSAKIKYLGIVHTITHLYNLKEAAEKTSHKCIDCDCYDGRRGALCLPKIHAMTGTDECECMKTLSMQPRD